jgi:predicted Zn-dependent protease
VPNFTETTKHSFEQTSQALFNELQSGEDLVLNLNAENSTFVRFNGNKVRQNTSVEQTTLSLQLQSQSRTTQIAFSLTGHSEEDIRRGRHWLAEARKECAQLPEDPYQVRLSNNGLSEVLFKGELLPPPAAIEAVVKPAQGSDLAGLYCAGPVISANKNSKGQSHWFSTESFFMDYSLYNGEKAVKAVYAGTEWNQAHFEENLGHSKNQLALMNRPKKSVARGSYKTYLAPGAVAEILSLFGWGCLGYGDYKRGNSAFKKLADGEKSLAAQFHLKENFGLGFTPRFNSLGELAPEQMDLIKGGKLVNFLVSSRSAKEFSVEGNNASEGEYPRAIELMPGNLKREDILKELGTGLYLSNLHYLNWSDRQTARITGMTRYACFWVENGEIVAPIADLRFDESLFDAFGANLLSLTDFQEVEPATGTYEARSLGGKKNPGALINDFKFTL